MSDREREKVLKGLEMCIADDYCNGCPYERECDEDDHDLGTALMADALALLKEQSEADEVAPTISEGAEGEEVIYCGSCGTSLYHLYPWKKISKAREYAQYCRHCGKKVKWDDT